MKEGASSPHNPDEAHIRAWLSDVTPGTIHDTMWTEVNRRFPGVIKALRTHINQHYSSDTASGIYDGIALGLGALVHAEETMELQARLFPEGTANDTALVEFTQDAGTETGETPLLTRDDGGGEAERPAA